MPLPLIAVAAPLIWQGLAVVGGAIVAGFVLAGCGKPQSPEFGQPVDKIKPIDPPPRGRKKPDPPGDSVINKCVPPDTSLLFILRGEGIRYPKPTPIYEYGTTTNPDTGEEEETVSAVEIELIPSDSKTGYFVMSLDRLNIAQGEPKASGDVPAWTELKGYFMPSPFPSFDYFIEHPEPALMLDARLAKQVLNNLRRGLGGCDLEERGVETVETCAPEDAGDPERIYEGSWGEVYACAGGDAAACSALGPPPSLFGDPPAQGADSEGLTLLGANTSLAWGARAVVDPDTCGATIELFQAVQRPWGLELAQVNIEETDESGEPTERLVTMPYALPFYFNSDPEAPAPTFDNEVTLCDNAGDTPCNAIGMSSVDRITIAPIILPFVLNPEDPGPQVDLVLDELGMGGLMAHPDPAFVRELVALLGNPSLSFSLSLSPQ